MARKVKTGVAGYPLGSVLVDKNTIRATETNLDLNLIPNGTGTVTNTKTTKFTADVAANPPTTDGSLYVIGGMGVTGNVHVGGSVAAPTGLNNVTIGNTTPAQATFTDVTVSGLSTLTTTTDIISSKTGATGVVAHDFNEATVWVHRSIAANFTVNLQNVPTTNGRTFTVNLILFQGATAFYANALQINGVAQTIRWAGSITPTATANYTEIQTFTITRIGNAWTVFGSLASYGQTLDGSTSTLAAPSASFIKNATGTNTDGVYWINLPIVGPTQVYCIMDSAWDGGGWMMAMKAAATGTTFNYDSTYWTAANTLNPTATNQTAGDAKFNTMNYFRAKDIMARWPDIAVNGGGIPGRGVWTWLENNFYYGTRSTLINFFSITNNVYKNDAKLVANWQSGVFSSQVGYKWYGLNYTENTAARVRWGFGWNNETNGFSNDVSGGIGLAFGVNWSAGDRISCCNDTLGINRQARVEIYVR